MNGSFRFKRHSAACTLSGRVIHAAECRQERALPRARLPHEGDEFSGFDGEVDPALGLDGFVAAYIILNS